MADNESQASRWNPRAASEAHARAQREREKIQDIKDGIERIPDPRIEEKTAFVVVDGERLRLSLPEYMTWMTQQAELADRRVEQFGGQQAIKAWERRSEGISYAGEIPARDFWSDAPPSTTLPPQSPQLGA